MPFPHPAQLIAAVRARFVGDVIDPELVPTPEEARNGRLLQAEAPFASLLFGAQSFYALFAIQLGASNFLVGWLTSGQALLNLLIGIPIARLVERHSRQFKLPLAAAALLMRVFTIAIVIIPLLPAVARPWVLVILVSMAAIPNTLWMVSFWATFGEIFRSRLIPRIIGGRWAVFNISTVVQMLLLGWIIDLLPFPSNYQIVFLSVGLVTLISVWLLLRLREQPRAAEELARAGARKPFSQLFREVAGNRRFMLLELAVVLLYLASYSAIPVFRIYWVRDLGATGAWLGGLTAALSVGGSFGNILWGRWAHPLRNRRNAALAVAGYMGLYPLLTSAFGSLPPLLAVTALAGFFAGGTELLTVNRIMEIAPREQRPTYIAVHNIAVNVAAFVGPLLSTVLASALGARPVLAGIGVAGLISGGLLYLLGWVTVAPAQAISAEEARAGNED